MIRVVQAFHTASSKQLVILENDLETDHRWHLTRLLHCIANLQRPWFRLTNLLLF